MNDQTERDNQNHAGGSDELAPAAGGTFGVTKDESGFGQGPVTDELARDRAPIDESGASYSGANFSPDTAAYGTVPREYGDAAGDGGELQADDFIDAGNGAHPSVENAAGTTEGSTGYAADGSVDYATGSGDGYGIPAAGGMGASNERGGFEAYAAGAGAGATGANAAGDSYGQPTSYGYGEASTTVPTKYGNEQAKSANNPLPLIGIAFAVIALALLCLPGIAWMFGGAAGVIAVIVGFLAARGAQQTGSQQPGSQEQGTHKQFGWLAVAGGGIAIALAVATAIVVYLV